MRNLPDDLIDTLIRPPRQLHVGFDWNQPASKLQPRGDAERHRLVAEGLRPPTDLRAGDGA